MCRSLVAPTTLPRSLLWPLMVATSFFAAVATLASLSIATYRIDGNSMAPSFADGDRVLVLDSALLPRAPEAGDTVIFRRDGELFIKRVAATPGERISEQQHRGQKLGSDEFYVLGDHRRISYDSRSFGPIQRDDIVGHVLGHSPFTLALSGG